MNCSADDMAEHVESCLSKQSGGSDGSDRDSSGSDNEFESYTWCGQTRIRATSVLGNVTKSAIHAFKCSNELLLV